MYLYVFYCLCYIKGILWDILEEQMPEERDPYLNEDEYIITKDSMEEHWRDVAEDGEDKSNIRALM